MPREQVVYIPNGPGISLRALSPAERAAERARLGMEQRPAVLVYSRLFEFDTARLAAVLAGIRAAVPDVAVLLVGAGLYAADSAAFRARLADAGLLDAVIDVGWTAREQLPATLAAADVGLYLMDDTLLNRTKCPVKLADMLVVGVPVVAEAVGQVSEYIRDGRTGALAASGDVAGLVGATVALLADAGERTRRGAAAREDIVTRFGWAGLAGTLEGVYAG